VPSSGRLSGLARRIPLPRRTVRLRLALLYGGVFLITGALLLGITYATVARSHAVAVSAAPFRRSQSHAAVSQRSGERSVHVAPDGTVQVFDSGQHGADVHVLAVVSVIALVAMAAIAMGLGWLLAGRVLRPLVTITSAAREISATDLHRRLALAGPDDEFKELGDTFDGLLGRLDASFQAQRQFVANASHELRTPLARLKTLAQVALADPDADAVSLREAHERVLASEQELEELIDALLGLAAGERALQRGEAIDLAAVTREVISTREADIERRGLELHAVLDAADIQGNAQLVERLAANLIDNAIRHNVAHGRLEVRTRRTPTAAVLTVMNDGPVVPERDVERLQLPFERLAAARTSRDEGHGLGLSIVDAIVSAHGASLAVHARPQGGLAVEVHFPRSP
jgi:signal transduction histidine kinase